VDLILKAFIFLSQAAWPWALGAGPVLRSLVEQDLPLKV
jgi:hypothetical protein